MLYVLLTQRDPRSLTNDTPKVSHVGWFPTREEAMETMTSEFTKRFHPGDIASVVEFPGDGEMNTAALWEAKAKRDAKAQEKMERETYERLRDKFERS